MYPKRISQLLAVAQSMASKKEAAIKMAIILFMAYPFFRLDG
jgi:hypothetical protein